MSSVVESKSRILGLAALVLCLLAAVAVSTTQVAQASKAFTPKTFGFTYANASQKSQIQTVASSRISLSKQNAWYVGANKSNKSYAVVCGRGNPIGTFLKKINRGWFLHDPKGAEAMTLASLCRPPN